MARLEKITERNQVPAAGQAAFDSITASRGSLHGPFTMMMHSPEMCARIAHVGTLVRFEGSLDMTIRVLAAMTVARELDAVYIWGAQTGQARKLGVSEATIAAIRDRHSRGVSPQDAQIVDFTRALLQRHRVDAAAFKAMQDRLGNDELIQLTGTIGYYAMLAMSVNACELEAAEGADALPV